MTICDVCSSRNPTTRCEVQMKICDSAKTQPSDTHFDLREKCLPLFWGAQFLIGMNAVYLEGEKAKLPRVAPAKTRPTLAS